MFCKSLDDARKQAKANARQTGGAWVVFTDTAGNFRVERQANQPNVLETHKPPQVVNGTSYHAETPPEVVRAIENLRQTGKRARLHYGNTETGLTWLDEWDMSGTIGRSIGPEKTPLLIARRDSLGGGGLLDHCIIRITVSGRDVYRHPLYHCPPVVIVREPETINGTTYPERVEIGGEIHARFAKPGGALKWVAKMQLTEFQATPATT